jgi:hypothetical protein
MMRSDADVWNELNSVKYQTPIQPGITTPGINNTAQVLALLDLPDDARGLRVLDLGTRDGFFAFEMERRGAEVIAVDYIPKDQTGFAVASAGRRLGRPRPARDPRGTLPGSRWAFNRRRRARRENTQLNARWARSRGAGRRIVRYSWWRGFERPSVQVRILGTLLRFESIVFHQSLEGTLDE